MSWEIFGYRDHRLLLLIQTLIKNWTQMVKLKTSKIWLLRKETFLASMNLWVGLTFMRKYDFSQLWFFYQSMFSLSIWLERLMKLIFLYENLTIQNSAPLKLRDIWHNLEKLYSECEKLSIKYGCEKYFQKNKNENIPIIVLKHLSNFADEWWRYFHIDELNWSSKKSKDPLLEWDNEINKLIIEKYWTLWESQETKDAINILNSWMRVLAFDNNWKIINNYKDLYNNQIKYLEIKQKYSMYYSFCLIKALCELQRQQSLENPINIDLSEFFIVFRRDYSSAKKYKSWNPNHPYKF